MPNANFPNHFGLNTASSGLVQCVFGFNASAVKIVNDGAGPLYVRFDGSTVASTGATTPGAFVLATGDGPQTFHDFGAGIGGLSYATSSTANNARVGAWG